jgi:hypothetical protein
MAASTAENSSAQTSCPEGSWSAEGQIAKMVGLCETQMESALQESDQAVEALVKAFSGLVDTSRQIGALAGTLSAAEPGADTQVMQEQLAEMSKQMSSAIVAFQFYDKLTQRMGHVRYSLSALALFVCNRKQIQQPEQWQRLHAQLRRLYRTEAEREVFQMVMDADDTAFVDAAAPSGIPAPAVAAVGEIELF